jgi:hypothetical protein
VDEVEFGRYRLLSLLGEGGMGQVWRAFDTVTERIVALKLLPTQYADDAIFQERFRREARSAAALDEPHVVPIHDFGEIDGRLFVTMRLIKGRDLHGILSGGPIDATRAVGIIDQVGEALHSAHQVGLIHRDVKPSNILVSDNDFAYLIDFGIARAAGQTGLTSTSAVIGTWAYMAPERFTAGQTDARADIYALACVLYECLTGNKPFGGDSVEQQIGGHLALPPPRASDHRTDVPAELDAVIAQGMAKNPDERYATTREMAHAARAALVGVAVGPSFIPPTIAAPPINGNTHGRTQPGYPADQTVWAGGPPPPGFAELAPAPGGPNPPGRRTSRKGWLIALSAVGAVVAIVAAIVLSQSSVNVDPAPSSGATPAALPNTGPFTGTFTAAMGSKSLPNGTPTTEADAAGFSETWRLRSACGANGCIATAATGGHYPAKDLVFDKVGGRWLAVTNSRMKCRNRNDDEAWNVISLQPQADGTLSGEWTQASTNGCFNNRTVVFTRTADSDISQLLDPASLPPRVVSLAAALHGRYDAVFTFTDGQVQTHQFAAKTDCLRAGDRCISQFREPNSGATYAFANGAWTRNAEWDDDSCHVSNIATLPLPQPPQDPIPTLTGNGSQIRTGTGAKCAQSMTFESKFTRTGD